MECAKKDFKVLVVTALQPMSMNDQCRLAVIVEASTLFCKVGAPHENPEGAGTPSLNPDPQDAVIVAITCRECGPGVTVQGLCPGDPSHPDDPDDFQLLVDNIRNFLIENLDQVTAE